MSRPAVRLLTGPHELLLRRAADTLLAELRGEGELDVEDLRVADLREVGLPDVWTSSLFGTPRAVVIRDAQDLPAATTASLLDLLDGPPPAATTILLASGTRRITKLAAAVKKAGGHTEVAPPREYDTKAWGRLVKEEARRHRRTFDDGAVEAMLAHAGTDVSTIVEKVAQVAAGAPAGPISRQVVDDLVVGVGSRGAFAVADAMCERDAATAVTLLRGAFEAGDDPVKVLGALVYRMRSVVAVAGGLDGRSAGVSLSPGMVRRMQALRRGFGPGELTRAYRVLADADLEIKSGDLPAELVVERAVVAIATPGYDRPSRLRVRSQRLERTG